jgi:hypothetical protein
MTKRTRGTARALLPIAMAASLALGFTCSATAEDRQVVVTTNTGERIEGVFLGASEEKLSVEVDGASLAIRVDDIRSVTFRPGAGQDVPVVTDLAGIQESLRPFQAALAMGMLRAQYAEKLQQVLPPVAEFIKTRKPYWYPDAQLALSAAMEAYKSPLATAYSWSSASSDWQRASAYLHYAEDIVRTDPAGHRESPAEKRLTVGVEVAGRIGFGDVPGPEFQGSQTLSDVYSFDVTRPSKILFNAAGGPCSLYEELRDSAGRDVSTMHAKGGWAAQLRPGTYRVVVYCGDGGVGTYKLHTEVLP